MGGGSTSHGTVLSGTANTPPSFDVRSWQGLTQVLKTGKESLKDAQAYAEFRNLVLDYAQKGGDAELRKKIDAVISTFSSPKAFVPDVSAPKKDSASPEPRSASEEVKETARVLGAQGRRRVPPRFVVSQSEMSHAKELKPEPVPAPAPAPEPEPAPVPPVPVPEPAPAPVPKAEIPSASAGFRTLDEYKARIAEIKRLVNAQVGNPAALIDTHNDLGKKYMTALLSALKATGGGGEGVDAAMANLETAFIVLMEGSAKDKSESAAEIVSTVAETDKERWEMPEKEKSAPKPEPAPELEPEPEPVPPEPAPEPAPEPEPVPVPPSEPVPAPRESSSDIIERAEEKLQSAMDIIGEMRPAQGIGSLFKSESVPPESTPPETPPSAGAGGWPSNRHVLRGIGKRTASEVRAEGVDMGEVQTKQTELSSPEITVLLHQLLNEWNIFHGSGFFGMGPSGPEHPLYKTLAPLSMGEVIAGRWEGANHKLTKTIKQYVDAWRHEQGIAYVVTETFEHYLRRVMQRIMKRRDG